MMASYPSCTYYYIGDNPAKDFVAPNRLGWNTVCLLDDGRNIHPQDFSLSSQMLPQHRISQLSEIENIII
jgi:putative hydrolase of the HAD superfamily